MPDLAQLRTEAEAAIGAAGSAAELEELRVRYLGRKSELTAALRSIGELPPERRGPAGKEANEVRRALESLLERRTSELDAKELDRRLAADRVDVTLPGDPPLPTGHLHLVSQIRRRMEDIFIGLGFSVAEGPEVEYEYYNFTALNHPPEHPARAPQDTFYLSERVLLRTHTSPMQVRAMELQEPPIYIVVPGRTYRPDTPDATHVPMFHQLEGLAIDEDITLADLQGCLLQFARQMFGEATEVRLRPGYFPFTEPSVEVDVSCFRCGGTGFEGAERCGTCKGEGWIEILGSGMVDPNVLDYVAGSGYDNERVQGFAWGMGIERIAMLVHQVPDLRMLYENDLRLLDQFGAGP
jgi:phenylalanyl-tRNA synthetase alpha chain